MRSDWNSCVLWSNSRDVLKRIPDNSIDLILTDPPYNLAPHSTGNIPLPGRAAMNNDLAEWDNVEFRPEEWADELVRILKPTGNLFVFTSYNQIGKWHSCLDQRFDTSNFMIWHKTNPAPKIFKAGFLNSCEMIFTCWNKKHTWNFSTQREMHNFIESPICMRPERLQNPKHPTQKPVAILKRLIEIASNKDDIVFDPFMGVGSTGVAAVQLGRKFIGVELDRSYFDAAKNRIKDAEAAMKEKEDTRCETEEKKQPAYVREAAVSYLGRMPEEVGIEDIFGIKAAPLPIVVISQEQRLKPIIKWPGGKEKELCHIMPNIPAFERYFEPFVGGGAVFAAIKARNYYINDLSSELVSLYRMIAAENAEFYKYAEAIDCSWKNMEDFFKESEILTEMYLRYRDSADRNGLREEIKLFCASKAEQIGEILHPCFREKPSVLMQEIDANLFRKMCRMREIEFKKNMLPESDLHDNIETALKSALYMNYRNLYNRRGLLTGQEEIYCALFLFVRNYAYSGMFRYNDRGEFNVPYGGIAYNTKTLEKKLEYYRSEALLGQLAKTHIYNSDFEKFLRETNPSGNDFIFLDPPYDSEFNTYAKNEFSRLDQERLANYLTHECQAQWMLVIKNTDFIYNLYNKHRVHISRFEKNYTVSFMNRNERKTTHLLITNY